VTGGSWTFDQGLQLAWKRKWVILQWAFVAATVGYGVADALRACWIYRANRDQHYRNCMEPGLLFRGAVLAFEDLTPVAAIYRSSELFRETWGEKVVGDSVWAWCFSS